jgi:hypothetical protein
MQKKALSEDRADDWAEAKSKVGQRAREEDMRSASEPGSREEDTIRVRCRDTGSEGGGYGARLSDSANMNSIELVDNTMSDMSAMQLMHGPVKKMWPRSRGERSHKVAETSPARRERSGAREEEKHPLCMARI